MSVKLCRSHWGRKAGWGCLRIGCWGEYLGLRGTRWQESGEIYVMRSLIITTPHPIFLRWSNREEWDGRVYSTCGREERCIQGSGGKPEGKRTLERLRCRWENNVKMDFMRWDVGIGTGLIWFRIETGGEHLWTRYCTFGFHKHGKFRH